MLLVNAILLLRILYQCKDLKFQAYEEIVCFCWQVKLKKGIELIITRI